jgi:hypothetical protein
MCFLYKKTKLKGNANKKLRIKLILRKNFFSGEKSVLAKKIYNECF